jgi:hypothetical protein
MPALLVGGPHVSVTVAPDAARASATTGPSRIVVQSGAAFFVIEQAWTETQPHYHSPADHHDPIELGTEYAVIVVAVVVAGSCVMRSFVSRVA